MAQPLQIRNSTAEFLIFQAEVVCRNSDIPPKPNAEAEFEKYRIVQDRIFESDFDHFSLPTLPFEEDK